MTEHDRTTGILTTSKQMSKRGPDQYFPGRDTYEGSDIPRRSAVTTVCMLIAGIAGFLLLIGVVIFGVASK
jgi:hypothetical protein